MSERPAWLGNLFASIDGMDPDGFVSYLTDDATFRWGAMPRRTVATRFTKR